MGHAASRMNSLKFLETNWGPLSVMTRWGDTGVTLLGPLQDLFDVGFRHPHADLQ